MLLTLPMSSQSSSLLKSGAYFWPTLFTEREGTQCLSHSNSPRDTGRGQRGVSAREGARRECSGVGVSPGAGESSAPPNGHGDIPNTPISRSFSPASMVW